MAAVSKQSRESKRTRTDTFKKKTVNDLPTSHTNGINVETQKQMKLLSIAPGHNGLPQSCLDRVTWVAAVDEADDVLAKIASCTNVAMDMDDAG